MSARRALRAIFAALLTTFAPVFVAQPSVAATSTTFNITGVASLDGKGLSGVTAHLMQSWSEGDSYDQLHNEVTNSKGSYAFSSLPLEKFGDPYAYAVIFTDSAHRIVATSRYLVPKPGDTTTRNVTLKRAATLTGTLSRADGTTPHVISVGLLGGPYPRENGLDRYDDPTNLHVHSNGSFQFQGVPAGTYALQFSDDSGTYLDQCYDNVAAKYDNHYPECREEVTPEATGVTLVDGHKVTLNAQTMTHLANHISGTVKDPGGNVLKGIAVTAFPSGDGSTNRSLWSSTSHSTGNFKDANLPAGGWQLLVEDPSHIWASQWYDAKPTQTGATVLNVGPNNVTGLAITMLSRSIIRAIGTAGNGSATFDVTTTRKADGTHPSGSVTVNQGSKTKTGDLVNGHATITLSDLTPGHRTITVTYSGDSATAGTSKDVVVIVK